MIRWFRDRFSVATYSAPYLNTGNPYCTSHDSAVNVAVAVVGPGTKKSCSFVDLHGAFTSAGGGEGGAGLGSSVPPRTRPGTCAHNAFDSFYAQMSEQFCETAAT